MEHDIMEYDVVIVGAGPAGLSAAIRLLQQAQRDDYHLKICVLEKAAQVGAHLISGAVLNPKSLKELLPESWQSAPNYGHVTQDEFYYLNSTRAFRLPTPKPMRNTSENMIISLGELGIFLAEQATALGCEIYTGFAANKILYNEKNQVIGVGVGDFGIDKNGEKTNRYQPGPYLHAKQTLFAEGCRGQLSEELIKHYDLRAGQSPQTYGLGIKEVWRVPRPHMPGRVIHTIGWPLDSHTYGGSFLYYLSENRIALGLVVGLDYKNPWISPFEEMQKFKTHPFIRPQLEGGERLAYGARALIEGGWQSLPKLTFDGGMLLGDAAGFLNVPQIKGIHMAIQSGILAADACLQALKNASNEAFQYTQSFKNSWAAKELYTARNIRPGFHKGLWLGLLNAAFETYITKGLSPWTLKNNADHTTLKLASTMQTITYPKPDGKLTFDKLSSVYLTNTFHEENQPIHLKILNKTTPIDVNYNQYASPEVRYCPAGVYEIVDEDTVPKFQINAQNCIHCKTCDIKDPTQNILWTAPEGGGGPRYISM
jgi:electron-transferring-flavoprotein dehydrogenase